MSEKSIDYTTLNPLFRLSTTKILWSGKIKRIKSAKSKKKQILIIATPGIFFVERKTFPRTYSVSKYFSFTEIRLILIDSDSVIISFETKNNVKENLTITSKERVKFCSIIFSLIKSLYGENLNFRLECTSTIKKQFDSSSYLYETQCPLVDRFNNFLLTSRILKNSNLDLINENIELLKHTKHNFTFTGDLSASTFVSQIVQSISYDSEITTLTLLSLNFSSFLPHFLPILQQNNIISEIAMENVSFIGKLSLLSNCHPKLRATKFIFNNCELKTNDFISFIKFFQNVDSKIKSLEFNKCVINSKSIEHIFHAISNYECFKELNSLSFHDISPGTITGPLIIKLFSSNWISNNHCFNTLNLINCGLDIPSFIIPIFSKKSSIENIDFGGNNFLHNISDFPSNSSTLFFPSNLSFSKCIFSISSFQQLMKLIAESNVISLNFDYLDVNIQNSNENIDNLYDAFLNCKLNQLASFSWDDNPMNCENIEKFMAFLTINNESLQHLSLSNSIRNNIEKSMTFFNNFIDSSKLLSLIIRGTDSCYLGEHFYPPLQKIIDQKNIRILDITNQKIGQQGLLLLLELVLSTDIEELYFDGTGVTVPEVLIKFCNDLMETRLNKASWPENDEKLIISNASIQIKQDVKKALEAAKEPFITRFGRPDPAQKAMPKRARSSSLISISSNQRMITPIANGSSSFRARRSNLSGAIHKNHTFSNNNQIQLNQNSNSQNMIISNSTFNHMQLTPPVSLSKIPFDELSYIEPNIKKLICECNDITDIDRNSNIFIKKFYEINSI